LQEFSPPRAEIYILDYSSRDRNERKDGLEEKRLKVTSKLGDEPERLRRDSRGLEFGGPDARRRLIKGENDVLD